MKRSALFLVSALSMVTGFTTSADARTKNVILIHGAAVDGSTWRAVFDILARKGINVRFVQMPMEGFDADVAAARLILMSKGQLF